MGSKEPKRRSARAAQIERLESREVFSVDLLTVPLGGGIEQHALEESPPELQGEFSLEQHGQSLPLVDAHAEPPLIQHNQRTADFWYDADIEREFDDLFGGIEQTLASAHQLTGAAQARADYGFLGRGQTVAIIDSGIAWDHYALGGGYGANHRVVGGWDFTENDRNPYDDGTEGSHGTHVAGIIGATAGASGDSGVAPGVDLVGLRVFDDYGSGYFSWVESALRWVHTNRNAFENPITAVNLSLGTSWNSASVPSWAMLEDEFTQLEADGIFISVSAGNSFTTYNAAGLSYPAASSHVVPVMSVDDTGTLSYFSQRHERAIAAPGRTIRSTVPDYAGDHNGVTDDWANFSGTSMAAPYAAGASVIVREAMEFVGRTGIDQWDIYDHLMATADSFFDAATNGTYKRLNLKNAIDALMPTDDFGSSVVDAYSLGTLGAGSREIAGSIARLNDVDYFSFTAGSSGRITISADGTDGFIANWNGEGVVVGSSYSLDVVAGQAYSFGISSNNGLGEYLLEIDLDAKFSFIDLGVVVQSRLSDIEVVGDTWYRLTPGKSGIITAEMEQPASAGGVKLAWFSSNMEELHSSGSSDSRIDCVAAEGDEIYLRVTGSSPDLDIQLTNLLSVDGTSATIEGSSGDDRIVVRASAQGFSILVNGTSYFLRSDETADLFVNGGTGYDEIEITGSAFDDVGTIGVGSLSLSSRGYRIHGSGFENVLLDGGDGHDVVRLYDSNGDDVLNAWPEIVAIAGNGFANSAIRFEQSYAFASAGTDVAFVYDSSGDDMYRTWPTHVVMASAGYYNYASGFDLTYAYASAGWDTCRLYDSAGDDLFRGWPSHVVMAGDNYYNYARRFDLTYAYASNGTDICRLYDSAGNDLYRAWPTHVILAGSQFYNFAQGFDLTYAYSSAGNDTSRMYDSLGSDLFRAWDTHAVMAGDCYYNLAHGFRNVAGYAATGRDKAILFDSAYDDSAVIEQAGGRLEGQSFRNEVQGFDEVAAHAINGGYNSATIRACDFLFTQIGLWH